RSIMRCVTRNNVGFIKAPLIYLSGLRSLQRRWQLLTPLKRLPSGALGQNHFRQCNKKSAAGKSTRRLKE
ncbi:hypothetical protein, partial [Salmonella enterica]|uniref:hypothetical protein n=1 Tax=Salmonella enterica TaxID=28901 RepID=UPI004027FC06